jgi:hypothetical protein
MTVIMPSHGVVIAKNAWSPVKNAFNTVKEIAAAVIQTQAECANDGFRSYGFDSESQCTSYVAQRGATPTGPLVSQP